MNKFGQSVTKVVGGAARSFARFPAAMISSLVIAGSASYLVQMDNVFYNKFYQSLQLGFVFAALLGMVVAVVGISRRQADSRFLAINLLTLGVGGLLFFLINSRVGDIPQMTVARVFAGAAILLFLFILMISRQKTGSDFNQASFMTLKSGMIALLYGLVILAGLSFIAFAVQTLLYENMSEKVYQHIAVWSAFLWFAFFLGYFPDFSPELSDPQLEVAQKQPRFIEVLFVNVLIPIITALTAVLLIWVVQILIVGKWPDFEQLSTIFSGYSILGIWLFIMVSNQDKPLAKWFRRVFPIVLPVFLAFEGYAIFNRVRVSSFMASEYVVSLIWIYALASALVLLIRPVVRNRLTAVAAMVLIAVAVMPVIGYQDFTISSQSSRLFKVLTRNQMIVSDKIQPAPATITTEDKGAITQAASFLLRQDKISIATWFDNSIKGEDQFISVFGFSQEYGYDPGTGVPRTNETYLYLPQGSIGLTGYSYVGAVSDMFGTNTLEIKSKTGVYTVRPTHFESPASSVLTVVKDGKEVLSVDVLPFIKSLGTKYRGVNSKETPSALFEDMILKAEKGNVRILVVFQMVQISDTSSSSTQYTATIKDVFLGE